MLLTNKDEKLVIYLYIYIYTYTYIKMLLTNKDKKLKNPRPSLLIIYKN